MPSSTCSPILPRTLAEDQGAEMSGPLPSTGVLVGDETDRRVLLSQTPSFCGKPWVVPGGLGVVWRQERGFTHGLLSLWGGMLGVTACLVLPQLKATDADEGEFGRVWYRILHGEWAALGQRGPALLPSGWRGFSRLPGVWAVRPREPEAPYARVGKGRKRTFSDHSHQVGCLSERAAFDCYALNVLHMEYHPDRGALG